MASKKKSSTKKREAAPEAPDTVPEAPEAPGKSVARQIDEAIDRRVREALEVSLFSRVAVVAITRRYGVSAERAQEAIEKRVRPILDALEG